jgi:HEAT repeats/HEAT repeat
VTHAIVERLRSPDKEKRRRACADAVEDPSATLLVDALCERLGDADYGVRCAAAAALAALAQQDPAVRRALDRNLRGDDPALRIGAALAYARIEPPSLRQLSALLDATGSADRHTRWAATKLLVDLGRRHTEAFPVLLDRCRTDPRPIARRMATHALRELAPDRPETALALLAASEDADLIARRAALAGLAALLDPPAAVLERLARVLDSAGDGASRRIAAAALCALGPRVPRVPSSVSSALRAAARDREDPALRRAAARALERVAPASSRTRAAPRDDPD